MLCNMFLYVVQHIFHSSVGQSLHFLQASPVECTKSTATKSTTRHRRNGERVALRHYLARAAMERMAQDNARDSHEPRASNPYYL